MSNSFGNIFKFTTFGESHGPAIGVIIDGVPSNFPLDLVEIQHELDRRKPGQSKLVTQRKESDTVIFKSGIFEGFTTGTPLMGIIYNEDNRGKDYEAIRDIFRPGHADFTYQHKYGIRDYNGGGRSSARETACKVIAGAVAKQILKQKFGIEIYAYLSQMGTTIIPFKNQSDIETNDLYIANNDLVPFLTEQLTKARRNLDSLGGKISVVAKNVPIGIGEPIYNKLSSQISFAMFSINAVKGVEIGDGFNSISAYGSHNNDQITDKGFITNHSGGILGGISNGEDILVNVAIKPTPSIAREQNTITNDQQNTIVKVKGRHDPCCAIRAIPVCEAMMAVVLLDQIMLHTSKNWFGNNSNSY